MRISRDEDVPNTVDFQNETEVLAWVASANEKRPWRFQFIDQLVREVAGYRDGPMTVLELGSGPGFLAERILRCCPSVVRYTALDYSETMLGLSRERLRYFHPRVHFVQANFSEANWAADAGGPFDCVVTMQAVHEVRHKRHVPTLYDQLASVLVPAGMLLNCDHIPEDDNDEHDAALFMTPQEQVAALTAAGFAGCTVRLAMHGMVLCRAYLPAR